MDDLPMIYMIPDLICKGYTIPKRGSRRFAFEAKADPTPTVFSPSFSLLGKSKAGTR
jgi:hypothetical protein